MARQEFPDQETQNIIDAVFSLKIETKHRIEDLMNAVHRLSVDYNQDLGSTLAIGDTLRTIYDETNESIAAIRAIVEVEVLGKVRHILDADEPTH